MALKQATGAALNGVCPYFTMFPLAFPLKILKSRARESDLVLDPFCGRELPILQLGCWALGPLVSTQAPLRSPLRLQSLRT